MDLGTVVGLVSGVLALLFAVVIAGIGITPYIDYASALMVLGGSFGAIMVSNPILRVFGVHRLVRIALRTVDWQEEQLINSLVSYADRARREGLLTLEDEVERIEDKFFRKGVQMVIDGMDPEIIKTILQHDLQQLIDRHEKGIKLFEDWGKLAPAFGLLGTLVGLVAMLSRLESAGENRTAVIGPGLALALLTTMYGAILANLFLIPIGNKLLDKSRDEERAKRIIIEGVLSIQSGDNPRILREKLLAYLSPQQRDEMVQGIVNE